MLEFFVEYIVSFFTTVIPIAIGWTTLAFIIIQHIHPDEVTRLSFNKDWDPMKLPPVPNTKHNIKRSEPIIAIMIHILIIVFLSFSHEHVGIWLFENGKFIGSVSFLNEVTFPTVLPFIILLLSLQIVKELLKLIIRKLDLFVIDY